MREKTYRKLLWFSLILTCMVLIGMWLITVYKEIPDKIKIRVGEEQTINLGLPVSGNFLNSEGTDELDAITVNGMKGNHIPKGSNQIDLAKTVHIKSDTETSYKIGFKLFGLIPFKYVDVDVIPDTYLIPVGKPVGIYLKTEGILVVDCTEFMEEDGTEVSPAKYILQEGDYIYEVNHEKVDTKKEFMDRVEQSEGEPLILQIGRDGGIFEVEVYPKKNADGVYKLGIWIRDSAQGIGTMTYIDEEGDFGALGHGISDIDVNENFKLKGGTLYDTEIIAIKRGQKGKPGEMSGMISYSDNHILGSISKNSNCGIFGTVNDKMKEKIEEEALPMALKQEVEIGAAKMLCTINGETDYYDIEIKEIYLSPKSINKGMVIEITDAQLLSQTGGIIQGMSGAPIIQNGKFVGAVTHVLVNNPARGYGIFIEDMLEQ